MSPAGPGVSLVALGCHGATHTPPLADQSKEVVLKRFLCAPPVFSRVPAHTQTHVNPVRLTRRRLEFFWKFSTPCHCFSAGELAWAAGSLSMMELEQTDTLLDKPSVVHTVQKEVIPRGGCVPAGRASVPRAVSRHSTACVHLVSRQLYSVDRIHTY